MTLLIVVLLVLGLALLAAEAHLPSFGVVGVAGIASLASGLVLAFVGSGASVALALAVTLPFALAAAGLGVFAARKALAAGRRQARGGAEGLIGHVGVVRRPLDPLGQVMVDGELWRARRSWELDDEDEPPPAEGDRVVVDRVQGLTLSVHRAEVWELEP